MQSLISIIRLCIFFRIAVKLRVNCFRRRWA